ncbi:hypothetical protein [Hyphobacterium indicum]|uniref:hypothetical protein n=1 Tax=Hyphobacterium indicum TaxID=2162714 RepID=UPI000D64E3C0|nr:hypothetical protein [Hyphobacterium indicum]
MTRIFLAFFAFLLASSPVLGEAEIHFDDLRLFAEALEAIDAGEAPLTAFERYVDEASPAFHAFAERYGTTAESIAAAFEARPNYYRTLPSLEAYIMSREGELNAAIERLSSTAPAGQVAPIFFLVADQTAGGTPVRVNGPDGPAVHIAIAIDAIALTDETDLSEFPNGTGGRARASDLPQVAVHEDAHVLQMWSQGGIENYLSIYNPDNGNMLAVAVREGCAEYVTYLASGWRLGDRHIYGEANELALWSEFEAVMDAPPFSAPGWFSGRHPDHTDWPAQIGYWMGFRICEHHHQSAANPDAAIHDLFTLHSPEELRPLAEAYGASLSGN